MHRVGQRDERSFERREIPGSRDSTHIMRIHHV
jgi:hypothetical protein